jgi:hypothetical protein
MAFFSTPSDLVRFELSMNGGRLLRPATVQSLEAFGRTAGGYDGELVGVKVIFDGELLGVKVMSVADGPRTGDRRGRDVEHHLGGHVRSGAHGWRRVRKITRSFRAPS